MNDRASLFDLQNVAVSYAKEPALHDITLKIHEGEKVALIGPSGAGKTTLLHKLYDLRPNESAFVYQHYALVSQLSTFHNTYIGRLDQNRTLYNLLNLIKPQKRILTEVSQILEVLGLSDNLHEKVGSLSGGQQQRVAISRALYRKSQILLADEPVSSIDPHQADKILKLILESASTVVLSLHSVSLALQNVDRIVGLRKGRIFFDLPSAQVTDSLLSDLYQAC